MIVSNAGYAECGAIEELTDEQIERQLQTNLVGGHPARSRGLPRLRAQGGGTSCSCRAPPARRVSGDGHLLHDEWALEGFYETLGVEVAPFGIRTTIVEPGSVRNEFLAWRRGRRDAGTPTAPRAASQSSRRRTPRSPATRRRWPTR